MMKRRPQRKAKKLRRNPVARALSGPLFRGKAVEKKTGYRRRPKHPGKRPEES